MSDDSRNGKEYRLLSAWAYVGYSLLFMIPIIGIILLIVFSFNKSNLNRRNYARSIICGVILVAVLLLTIGILTSTNVISEDLPVKVMSYIANPVGSIISDIDDYNRDKARSAFRSENTVSEPKPIATTKPVITSKPIPSSTSKPTISVDGTAIKPIGSTQDNSSTSARSTIPSTVVNPDFKKLMDSYEVFFDEYIAFMKKYENYDGSTTEMLSDYTTYMMKYADMMEKLEAIDDDELNSIDMAYYIQVTSRIYQKLSDYTQ